MNLKKLGTKTLWTTLILLSAYYLYRAILFRFFKEGTGPTFWNKQFLFVFHLLVTLAPLTLGPLQFWKKFRNRNLGIHRMLGKIYIYGSLMGGLSALILGITQPYPGSIVPVVILALLWLFMTSAAWVTILKKDVENHRLFMIRSYTLALTFVFLRLFGDLAYDFNMLFFIENDEVKDATYEWMSWVLPLVAIELVISWIPALKKKKHFRKSIK